MTRRELLFVAVVVSIGAGWVLWKVYSPTALLAEYSRQGNVEGARRLLNLGVDPNAYHHRASAFIAAADGGHVPVLDLLLKHGAHPLQCEADGSAPRLSALSAAAFFDHVDAIEYLVKVGIPIEYQCGGGWPPPLEIAAEYGRPSAAAKLIQLGANPRRIGQGGNTYVMSAAWSADVVGRPSDAASTIELLVNSGCDVNARSSDGRTALMRSVEPAVVKMLLQKGAAPNLADLEGTTPLLHLIAGAVWMNDNPDSSPSSYRPETLELLLRAGADPNARSSNGDTPLALCAKSGKYRASIERVLRHYGARQ